MKRSHYALLFAILTVTLFTSACATTKKEVTPLERAKQVVGAANVVWNTAQKTFAGAYLDGKITEAQWQEFRTLDGKALSSGRALRDAVRAWEIGVSPSPEKMTQLTTSVLRLYDDAVALAVKFGLAIPSAMGDR